MLQRAGFIVALCVSCGCATTGRYMESGSGPADHATRADSSRVQAIPRPNPDGEIGTTWIDIGAQGILSDKQTITIGSGYNIPKDNEMQAFGIGFGTVITPEVSFRFNLSWDKWTTKWVPNVLETEERRMFFSGSLRFYVVR